jgi:hypothetical protein
MYLNVYFLFSPPTLVAKERTSFYSSISIDLEPNEKEKEEEKKTLTRAHLFANFIQLFVLDFCQCITPFLLFFFGGACVRTTHS